MQTIKIQCPAKINLNLKILGKLPNGFHEIESIMQTINLFDYLKIAIEDSTSNEITLSGNNDDIPYDEKNLVYKAAKLYLETSNITNKKISIYIEKNIPIAAGLAGGSTDAAGTLYGLNKIFNNLNKNEINQLCAQLGSDLNVCLHGGRILAKGRGEIITPLEFEPFDVSLIKPLNLGISAKEAYTKYAQKLLDCHPEFISGSVNLINQNYTNHLEWAIIDDYPELQYIKQKYPQSVMTGSGSTFFIISRNFEQEENYYIKNNLKAIDYGVKEI